MFYVVFNDGEIIIRVESIKYKNVYINIFVDFN